MGPNKITIKKKKKGPSFDIETFKLDIDDLIQAFVKVIQALYSSITAVTTPIDLCYFVELQDESRTLVDMKRVWIKKKFSYIFEARPTTNIACFMQSLYSHSIGTSR